MLQQLKEENMAQKIILSAACCLAFAAGWRIGSEVETLWLAVVLILSMTVLIGLCAEVIASCWD